MGCTWSEPSSEEWHALVMKEMTIDPVEEHLHIKAWRDPNTRTRVLAPHREAHPPPAAPGIPESLISDLASHQKEPGGSQQEGKPAPGGEGKPAPGGAGGGGGCGQSEAVRTRLEAVEREQATARKRELLKVDPECWSSLAAAGYFQKADDTLRDAAEAERELVGTTVRLARLEHALGALFDHRSNVDMTGQQQALSLRSAQHAQAAIAALQELGEEAKGGEGSALMYTALLLRGRSLCNFALDGDSKDMLARQAFEEAEDDLKRCVGLAEEMGGQPLAEALMAVGYLHYCKAGCTINARDCSMVGVITPRDTAALYKEADSYYTRSLALSVQLGGEEHQDSIRMMCNIALVHNAMSRLRLPDRLDSLAQAREWYQRALKFQEKAFGKRHDRTLRIRNDLQDVVERIEEASAPPEVATELASRRQVKDDDEREREASALMEQFLKARREERLQEQTTRVHDLLTRQQRPPSPNL